MSNQPLNIDLFISTQCPHCAQTLELLSKAVKQGLISGLRIINLNSLNNPECYAHIRSVPFIQIDDYEFPGSLKQSELDDWLKAHHDNNFANYYFSTKFIEGDINQVENFIKRKPDCWLDLVKLVQDSETQMQIRIGITAIFESMSEVLLTLPLADEVISSLIQATKTANHTIRVDLIYILSLIYAVIRNQQQKHSLLDEFLVSLLNDPSDEIKEILEDMYG